VAWCVAPPPPCVARTLDEADAGGHDGDGGDGGEVGGRNGEDDDEDGGEVVAASALVCDVLRWLVAARLPPHMIPARFGFLRQLPKTATGKVARAPLAKRDPPPVPDRRRRNVNSSGGGDGDSTGNGGGNGGGGEAGGAGGRLGRLGVAVAEAWEEELGAPVHEGSGGAGAAAHFAELGRAVQVDPMEPKLKPPGAKRLKLKCDILLSTSAFKFILRRYS